MNRIWIKTILLIALLALSPAPQTSRAQTDAGIKILEPAEGAQITGPFTVRGTANIPVEDQLSVRVTATSTNEKLIEQMVPVVGATPGSTLVQFRVTLNYTISGDTPARIEVFQLAGSTGKVVTQAQVNVSLHKYDPTPVPPSGDETALAAITLALSDYEGRVQITTPIPQSMEDRAFNDSCIGLARPGETCAQGQVPGKVVKLSYGGVIFTYHVGNNQARLNEAASAPINQKGTANVPKILTDASAATGVKLYVPGQLTGPFNGLFFTRAEWSGVVVTVHYAPEGNPVNISLTEYAGNDVPQPAQPNGEKIKIGEVEVPVQVAEGRKFAEWKIANTIIRLSVPQNIKNEDLTTLANSFMLLGSTQPGQTNLRDLSQFDKLTMNLPEPTRSLEMARQAFMTLVKPARQGHLVSIQAKQFANGCLDLPRQNEACTQSATPGYVIGVADTELYRYHVAGNTVRLNRGNSELRNKSGADYATIDAARAAAGFVVAAPADPNVTLLGAESSPINNVPTVLLIYRENQTGGVIALRETARGTVPAPNPADQKITVKGKQIAVKSEPNGNGLSTVFIFQQAADKSVLVSLWASPEIGLDVIARIAESLAG